MVVSGCLLGEGVFSGYLPASFAFELACVYVSSLIISTNRSIYLQSPRARPADHNHGCPVGRTCSYLYEPVGHPAGLYISTVIHHDFLFILYAAVTLKVYGFATIIFFNGATLVAKLIKFVTAKQHTKRTVGARP